VVQTNPHSRLFSATNKSIEVGRAALELQTKALFAYFMALVGYKVAS
jgi:hypothetical protein